MKRKIKTWEEITKPLKEAAKVAGIKESDIPEIIHRFREKRQNEKKK